MAAGVASGRGVGASAELLAASVVGSTRAGVADG